MFCHYFSVVLKFAWAYVTLKYDCISFTWFSGSCAASTALWLCWPLWPWWPSHLQAEPFLHPCDCPVNISHAKIISGVKNWRYFFLNVKIWVWTIHVQLWLSRCTCHNSVSLSSHNSTQPRKLKIYWDLKVPFVSYIFTNTLQWMYLNASTPLLNPPWPTFSRLRATSWKSGSHKILAPVSLSNCIYDRDSSRLLSNPRCYYFVQRLFNKCLL